MICNLIKKGLREPYKIPQYIYRKVKFYYYRHVKGRVYFDYSTGVVGGEATRPAEYSCRLYEEVRLLKRALLNYHAKRSLEIGCGYGRLTPWIEEHSDAHYAVDPVSEFLNDARRLYPEVDFRQAIAQSLPFSDDYFDLIVSWTVLQHIPPKEIFKAVKEIKRVAEPKAVIILAEATEYADHLTYWEHSVEEWERLLKPWKIFWKTERKLRTATHHSGMVMRFERE